MVLQKVVWTNKAAIGACGIHSTYSLGFFFGPGLPLGFGRPSAVTFAVAAERLTPFFFVPSGGAMTEGVPSAAGVAVGVAAFESDAGASSGFEFAGALDADADADGDSLVSAGVVESSIDSCLTRSSGNISRSFEGETLSTSKERLVDVLFEGGAIVPMCIE